MEFLSRPGILLHGWLGKQDNEAGSDLNPAQLLFLNTDGYTRTTFPFCHAILSPQELPMAPKFWKVAVIVLACVALTGSVLAGDPVTAKTPVKKGDMLLAEWARKWEDVQVLEVAANGNIKIRWLRWGPQWDEFVPRAKLRLPDSPVAKGKADAAGPAKNPLAAIRNWTDISGKHKIEAEFVKFADGKVTLKKKDGQEVSLLLEKLSEADQDIAKSLGKDSSPFEPAAEDVATNADDELTDLQKQSLKGMPPDVAKRFEEQWKAHNAAIAKLKSRSSEPGNPAAKPSVPEATYPTSEADWSAVNDIFVSNPGPLVVPADAWKGDSSRAIDRSIALSDPGLTRSDAFFERLSDLVYLPGANRMWVVFRNDSPRPETTPFRLEACDLVEGKSLGQYAILGKFRPLAGDPAGRHLLTGLAEFNNGNQVDLWKLNEQDHNLQHVIRWVPVRSAGIISPTIKMAEFLDQDHVLICDSNNSAILWQVGTGAKAIYSLPLKGTAVPRLTPSRKYLVASVEGGIGLFHALTGKPLGMVPLAEKQIQSLSLRADGKQLAISNGWSLLVYDCQTGRQLQECALVSGGGTLDWAGNDLLLVDGLNLYDPALGVLLWKYERTSEGPVIPIDNQFWFASAAAGGTRKSLTHAPLPHGAVKQLSASLNPQNLRVFKPGTKVRLQLNLSSLSPDQQQKASAALTAAVVAAGGTVANDGPLVLEAGLKAGEPKAMNFGRTILRSDSGVFIAQSHWVALKEGEKVLWSSSFISSAPHVLHMKKGQTVEMALRELSQPNPGFYTSIRLHPLLMRPGDQAGAYGKSPL
jgi:hypothetical protein